jgi:hypothetical protein
MGRKSTLKKIKRLADTMTPLKQIAYENVDKRGSELIAMGITKLTDGTPVDPVKKYTQHRPKEIPVNHNRKMKKLHRQYGLAGIKGYIQAVEKELIRLNTPSAVGNDAAMLGDDVPIGELPSTPVVEDISVPTL